MNIIKYILSILLLSNIIITQNYNFHNWHGLSTSTSDNLDALHLNPAGLGIKRSKISGFAIKETLDDEDNISGNYFVSLATRYPIGFAIENYYDGDFHTSVGYGTEIYNNIYLGASYHTNDKYTLGILLRPSNVFSIGFTKHEQNNSDTTYSTGSFAIRPFEMITSNSNFINNSNLTLGYEKTYNTDDEELFLKEKSFISFSIVEGVDLSMSKYDIEETINELVTESDGYKLNLSFNIGSTQISLSNHNKRNNNIKSFSIVDYSQKLQNLNDLKHKTSQNLNYIEIDLNGLFIEEKPTINPFTIDIDIVPFISTPSKGKQLKQWIDYIDKLSEDANVDGLIIKLGSVQAGLAKKREMHKALTRFKNSNKKIIVYSENYISGSDYYLVSIADEIYTHRMSGVDLKGLNMEMTFMRGLLDTLSIVPEVIRVSPYKTAGDTFLNKKSSDEMKENYSELIDDLYNVYVKDISNARGWSIENTLNIINNGPYFSSLNAIENGLITDVMFPDQFDKYVESLNDKKISINKSSNSYFLDDYTYQWKKEEKPEIAVIYAVGGIMSGKSNPGPAGSSIMGDKTINNAIKKAREDENIKAIVLRIDSGGGSALASDMMWREVYKTTVEDTSNIKPFIVSMSDVAASGGYYIACQADTILAEENTITGSIGVIGVRLNFSQLLNRIGINIETLKRGDNADFGTFSRLLTDDEKQKIYNSIMDSYSIFKERVIEGRDNLNDIEALDDIALGRVWSGQKAMELGLVDKIGGLHDAIEVAKNAANIDTNQSINILEYPEVRNFNFFSLINDEAKLKINKLNYYDFFPEELAKQLEALDIIPIIQNDEIQFLMPYKITIK